MIEIVDPKEQDAILYAFEHSKSYVKVRDRDTGDIEFIFGDFTTIEEMKKEINPTFLTILGVYFNIEADTQ